METLKTPCSTQLQDASGFSVLKTYLVQREWKLPSCFISSHPTTEFTAIFLNFHLIGQMLGCRNAVQGTQN